MLAVAGRCRVIRIYHILPGSGAGNEGVKIVLDRSITGHGGVRRFGFFSSLAQRGQS